MLKVCTDSGGKGQAHSKELCWGLQDAANVLGSRTTRACHVLVLSPQSTPAYSHCWRQGTTLKSLTALMFSKAVLNFFWLLICNLETETYSEKMDMLVDPLRTSLALQPSNPPSFLVSPSWECSQGTPCLSKSHVWPPRSLNMFPPLDCITMQYLGFSVNVGLLWPNPH